MTAPVFSDGAKGAWRTRFVMPARFTAATLPDMPDGVTAAELPARRMAIIRFAGSGSGARLAQQEARLRAWLTSRGLEARGDVVTAFYNSPFVAPPFRRNEVMIAVGRRPVFCCKLPSRKAPHLWLFAEPENDLRSRCCFRQD